MIDWLIQLDHDITLGLNAMHTPVLDSIMLFLSSSKVWIPLYVLIAALMFIPKWYGRKSPAFRLGSRIPLWLTGLIGVLAVALCFGLTEQITNLVNCWRACSICRKAGAASTASSRPTLPTPSEWQPSPP